MGHSGYIRQRVTFLGVKGMAQEQSGGKQRQSVEIGIIAAERIPHAGVRAVIC